MVLGLPCPLPFFYAQILLGSLEIMPFDLQVKHLGQNRFTVNTGPPPTHNKQKEGHETNWRDGDGDDVGPIFLTPTSVIDQSKLQMD